MSKKIIGGKREVMKVNEEKSDGIEMRIKIENKKSIEDGRKRGRKINGGSGIEKKKIMVRNGYDNGNIVN